MKLRSGKALSIMSRPHADNINPRNNPQNVVQQPVITAVEGTILSMLVRNMPPDASAALSYPKIYRNSIILYNLDS